MVPSVSKAVPSVVTVPTPSALDEMTIITICEGVSGLLPDPSSIAMITVALPEVNHEEPNTLAVAGVVTDPLEPTRKFLSHVSEFVIGLDPGQPLLPVGSCMSSHRLGVTQI